MVPALAAALGVKGHRPTVGTRDREDLLYVFGVIHLVTAAVHANTLDSPKSAQEATGLSKTRRMQAAFAAHLRHIGRTYPAGRHPEVVLLIDDAPWHRGKVVDEAMAANPHRRFERLPSYRPRLNPVERFRKKLRRRATHNRLFDTRADLKASLRASLSYFQTVRHKVKSLIEGRPKRTAAK